MKNYLFLILATLLVFVSSYFIISIYFLSKLSDNCNEGNFKSSTRNEIEDDGFQFPDELDLSSLPSKYRTRNSKVDLIKTKLIKAFKSCDNSEKLNYQEVWSEASSVSVCKCFNKCSNK